MMGSSVLIMALVGVAIAVAIVLVVRNRSSRGSGPGRIVFIKGPRQGEEIELVAGSTRIGALDDNDIVIPSNTVSRYHAELRIRGAEVHIWDLQSRNLTYVNGDSVRRCELKPGDVITIGDAELRYER